MGFHRFRASLLFAAALGLFCGCASVDEGGGSAAAAADPMEAMQQEMMEWARFHAPNEHHEELRTWAGEYATTGRFWPVPDAPPLEMTGASVIAPILDGRYLREDFTGDFMGQPFTGMALVGYDNQEKDYFSIWVDSGSTNFMVSRGNRREDGTLEMVGEMTDPKGVVHRMRTLLRRTDDGGMTFEMYEKKGTDPERKHMEMSYTRKP